MLGILNKEGDSFIKIYFLPTQFWSKISKSSQSLYHDKKHNIYIKISVLLQVVKYALRLWQSIGRNNNSKIKKRCIYKSQYSYTIMLIV